MAQPCMLKGIVSADMHQRIQASGVSCTRYDRDSRVMVIAIDRLDWNRKILTVLDYVFYRLMDGSMPTMSEDAGELIFTEKL